jgi:hypothetical protein
MAFNGQPLKATMPCEKGGQALAKPTEEELDLLAEVGQVSKPVISLRVEIRLLLTDLETCPIGEYEPKQLHDKMVGLHFATIRSRLMNTRIAYGVAKNKLK